MDKAALFFDVDGTLIDEQTKIVPESTLRALKQARENGNHLSGKCADAQYTDQGAVQTLHTGDSGVSYGRSSGSQ